MNRHEFRNMRRRLAKTQKEIAQLLGSSVKAVQGYEQGWRSIPVHVERQMFYLAFQGLVAPKDQKSCWKTLHCPKSRRDHCPAGEFKMYKLCWFICGTTCQGIHHRTWQDKMEECRKCPVFQPILEQTLPYE